MAQIACMVLVPPPTLLLILPPKRRERNVPRRSGFDSLPTLSPPRFFFFFSLNKQKLNGPTPLLTLPSPSGAALLRAGCRRPVQAHGRRRARLAPLPAAALCGTAPPWHGAADGRPGQAELPSHWPEAPPVPCAGTRTGSPKPWPISREHVQEDELFAIYPSLFHLIRALFIVPCHVVSIHQKNANSKKIHQ